MNLFDLGGQLLRVGKAITPPETVTPPNSNLLNQPFGGYAGAAAAATSAISALNPSIGLSIPSLAASGALNTPGLASKLSEIVSLSSFPFVLFRLIIVKALISFFVDIRWFFQQSDSTKCGRFITYVLLTLQSILF